MHDWKTLVRQRLAPLRLTANAEAGLVEEVGLHLEDHYRELCSGGTGAAEAYRQTIAELDDLYPLRVGEPTMARRGSFVEDLWKDLRYAGRTMRKSPMFVSFVVLTLALGIGANTTVFTVINTLILNPLPVQNAGELAAVTRGEGKGASQPGRPLSISYADLKDYRAGNRVFRSLAGYTSPQTLTWQTGAASQGMFGELVTANYFEALGLTPARGRFFVPEEDRTAGVPVAVMNYGTWQSRFGGAADIVGRQLRINGIVLTVIGVAPPHFIGVNAVFGPDLWVPTGMGEQLLPTQMTAALTDRGKMSFLGVGRLQAGVTHAQAQANLASMASGLERAYPLVNGDHTVSVRPVQDVVFGSSSGSSTPVRWGSAVLSMVVGLVLLIACSNVANLLLARSASRQQEMAVRLAMGASRSRLVRQLLTESVLLGLLGGSLGMFLAYAGLQLLFGMLPGSSNFVAPKMDATVLGFAALVSLATGFLFGTIPALQTSRNSVAETLKEGARTAGRSRRRITAANALLVGQVAFSFLLLVTAVLFLRSIGRAYEIDPGFQVVHLAVLPTNPGQAGYGKPQTKAFYTDVRDRVGRLAGVEAAEWSSNMPLWARSVPGLQVEGREQRSRADTLSTVVNTVGRNYFDTMGVTITSGRRFTNLDGENTTPVAIVNEKLAQDYWPGATALGKRIQLPGETQKRQIVGIARTANYTAWGEPPQVCVYVPMEQNYGDGMILYVRSKVTPDQILTPVRLEIGAAAPQVLVGRTLAGREIIEAGLFQARMGVALLGVFGLLALGLAGIGLYGIMAFSVNQRRREIGLRMALGAPRGSVLRMVLRQGMSVVVTGMSIGFAGALLLGRLLSRMLYGVSATDPVSVAGAALVLSAAALLACYLPARWATRVDPLTALREA